MREALYDVIDVWLYAVNCWQNTLGLMVAIPLSVMADDSIIADIAKTVIAITIAPLPIKANLLLGAL